jgi:SAM-dependent methyltransferase
MSATPFDRLAVRRHRDRAAAGFEKHDFLFREVAERLADRLDDVRGRFPLALDLGCRTGLVRQAVEGHGGIEAIIGSDLSEAMARRAPGPVVVADEEALPFADGAFDLIVSCGALHWTNDLPGALVQVRRALKPDGLFLAAFAGGETLAHLRQVLIEAELAVLDGASPRVSPVVDTRDAGMLLQRVGFALPVVDSDVLSVTYPDALALMRDLRGMGETNANSNRQQSFTRRAILADAAGRLAVQQGRADGRVEMRIQVLFITAWAPAPSQPKALRPGSAKARLADALGAVETSLE